jgi:uncharacterized SAM-binding protein YcdF (DUF218 family)
MKSFGDAQTVAGEAAMGDGSADRFEQWVFRAGESLDRAADRVSLKAQNSAMRRILWAGTAAAAAILMGWLTYVAQQIERQSTIDEARPADIIVVLGAAEYRGRPSPVLEARLNHALFLYLQGLAPLVLTTGGAGGDPVYTESEVGRTYLSRRGVPSESILVEPEGESTAHSTAAVAEMMRRRGLSRCIVVSDGYHIYRVKKMLEFRGLEVYGSPRPSVPKYGWRQQWQYVKQAGAFTLYLAGVNI